jgi:hypothetical protein
MLFVGVISVRVYLQRGLQFYNHEEYDLRKEKYVSRYSYQWPHSFCVCRTVQWPCRLWKLFREYIISIMARRRHIRDEDIESQLICDIDSDENI